jgi:signal transduction histidine kinase/CheY-like chemotaxis protein
MKGRAPAGRGLTELDEWRVALLETVLPWAGTSLISIPFLVAAFGGVSTTMPYWQVVLVGLLLIAGSRLARHSPRLVSFAFAAVLFGLVAERALDVGWAPGVVAGVVTLEIYVGLLLGRAAPYLLIVAVAAVFVAGGVLMSEARPAADFPPVLELTRWENWLRVALVLASLTAAAGMGLSRFGRSLELTEKRLATTVATLRAELERLARTREHRNKRERVLRDAQKLQTVAHLGHGFAHVFNNVLTALRSALEEARNAASESEVTRAAQTVREVVAGAALRSRDLLTLARPAGEIVGELELEHTLATLAPKLRERLRDNVSLEVDAQHACRVAISERGLEQILMNLVLNAEQAMPQGGRIEISARAESLQHAHHGAFTTLPAGEYLLLRVTDDGPGMTEDAVEHAFDPFFTTRRRDQHDGLGLTLVYDMVRRIGGAAEVEQVPRGASIAVRLPLAGAAPGGREDAEPVEESLRTAPPWKTDALRGVSRVGVVGILLAVAAVEIQRLTKSHVVYSHLLAGLPLAIALGWVAWSRTRSYAARLGVFLGATLGAGLFMAGSVGFMQAAGTVVTCLAVLLAFTLGRVGLGVSVLALMIAGYALAGWLHASGTVVGAVQTCSLAYPANWFRVAVSLSASSLMSAAAVLHVLGAARKRVDALAATEMELNRARDRQRAEADELVDLLAMAERARRIEALGRLTGMTAHDLNNSLHALNGWAEVLSEPTSRLHGPEQTTAFQEMDCAIEYAEALVSRLELGTAIPSATVSLDLGAAALRAQGMLKALLRHTQRLRVETAPDCTVLMDEACFRRILLNLVGNARDAMSAEGECIVRVARSEQHVEVLVEDDGAGMDEATRARLFEAFFTTKGERGTGLGLHSVAAIVEAVSGCIDVDSKLGKGTCFCLRMPHAPSNDQRVKPKGDSIPPSALGHLLLAEDEPHVRLLLARSLERAGFSVVVACDGDEALARIKSLSRVDALCTDAVMPGAKTTDLLRAFAERFPGRPALLMSGYLPENLEQLLLGEPVVTFLHKPFSGAQLVEAIKACLVAPHARLSEDAPIAMRTYH